MKLLGQGIKKMVQQKLESKNHWENALNLRESAYFEYMVNCKDPCEMPEEWPHKKEIAITIFSDLSSFYGVYTNTLLLIQAYNASLFQDIKNLE